MKRQQVHMGAVLSRIEGVKRAICETEAGNLDIEPLALDDYDVFISYRRSTGSEAARLLKTILEPDRRVFLDVEEPKSGYFETAILNALDKSANIVVVLSAGSLDAMPQETDWFRKELESAIERSKKIVPVCLSGFAMPEDPDALVNTLRRFEWVEWDHRYFDAMSKKLNALLDGS